MSKSIDERIVSMQFDNKNFEKNAATSMSTLDKLKEKLSFSGASKGLDELNSAVKGMDMTPLANAVEGVHLKFSAFEVAAIATLAKITSAAIDAGVKLVKSLSVDNISAGWTKFDDKNTAVATLSAQGYEIENINDQLEKLNYFTDETSYNFVDMVKEIGKFTASGQDLESSVTAIEGVATIAALSGQGAAKASQAMYQISQAMGKGVMKLDDWKSVENANMVTKELKQNIINAAVAMGTLKDNADGTYTALHEITGAKKDITFDVNSFSSSLSEGMWFTSDVMMSVFKDYGKASAILQAYVEKDTEDAIGTASDAIADFKQKAEDYISGMKALGQDVSLDDALRFVSIEEMKKIPAVVDAATDHMNEYNASLEEQAAEYMKTHPAITSVEDALKQLGLVKLNSVDESLIDMGYQLDSLALKAFEAGQEARTFKDVLDSVKDAVSTGWMNTFENIFGNYEEAKVLWTDLANELYDVFAEGGNARNEMLAAWKEGNKEWGKLGGRDLLFINTDEETGAFWNLFYALTDIINAVKEAFSEIFPPMTAERLYELTARFKEFTENIRLNEEQLENIKTVFKGLFSAMDMVGRVIVAIVKGFYPLKPIFKAIVDYVSALIMSFSKWAIETDKDAKELNKFEKITEGVAKAIQKIIDVISAVIGFFRKFAEGLASLFATKSGEDPVSFGERMSMVFNKLGEIVKKVIDKLGGIGDFLKSIFETVKPVLSAIFNAIKDTIERIVGIITGSITDIDGDQMFENLTKIFETGFLAAIVLGIKNIVKNVKKSSEDMFGFKGIIKDFKASLDSLFGFKDIAKSITDAFGKLEDVMVSYQNNLKADTLFKIAAAIGILTLSLVVLAGIDQEKLKSAISAITVLFAELVGAFAILNKTSKDSKKIGVVASGFALIELTIALLILAAAMKKIAAIEWSDIFKSMLVMGAAIKLLPMALNDVKEPKGAKKKGVALILVSTSLVILGSAMKKIAEIDWQGIAKSLISVAAAVKLLPIALDGIKSTKGLLRKAISLILLSTSLVILGSAMKKLAELSWEGIGKALASMTVALYVMSNSLNIVKTSSFGKALSLLILTTSLLILGEAMKKLASLSWEGIAKALVSMAVSLYLMTNMINNVKVFSFGKALSLLILATSLLILGEAMKKLASLSWEGIAKGLASMAVSLYLMTNMLNNVKGFSFGKAASLLLLSTTLLIVASYMTQVAELSWESIAKGLVSMAAAMAIMVLSLNLLKSPSTESAFALVTVAGILTVLGKYMAQMAEVSWEGILKGVSAMAATFLIMNVALNTLDSKGALKKAASLLLVSLALGVIAGSLALLGSIGWVGLIAGIVSLVAVLVVLGVAAKILGPMTGSILKLSLSLAAMSISIGLFGASAFLVGAALIAIGTGLALVGESLPVLAAGLAAFIPVLVEQLPILIVGILKMIADAAPEFANMVIAIVRGVLEILEAVIPDIIATLLRIIFEVLDELVPAIPKIVDTALDLIIQILQSIANNIIKLGSLLFDIIVGLLQVLVDYTPKIVNLLVDFIISVLTSLTERIPDIVNAAMEFIEALLGGVIKAWGELIGTFIGNIISAIGTAIADALPHIGEKLAEFTSNIQPFLDMANGLDQNALEGVKTLAEVILLITAAELISSLSDFLSFFGGSSSDKFGETIVDFADSMVKFAEKTKGIDAAQVESSANAAKALAEFANNLPKEGGFWQDLFGQGNLEKFGTELETFGPHLAAYAKTVEGIDGDTVVKSANAAKALADFANNLPKHDGEWQKWFGDSSLSTFAQELADFGPSLKSYAEQVKGLDSDAVTKSADAAEALKKFATGLPAHDGVWQDWVGDASLTSFAKELDSFAPSLVSYAKSVAGLDTDTVSKSVTAAQAISDLATGLPPHGGVVQWFTGDNTLSDFAEEIPPLGTALAEFAANMGGSNVSLTSVDTAVKMMDGIAVMCEKMSLVNQNSLDAFNAIFVDVPTTGIANFVAMFDGSAETIKATAENFIHNFNTSVLGKGNEIANTFDVVLDYAVSATNDKSNQFVNLGGTFVDNFITAIGYNKEKMKSAGSNLISGFISGMSEKKTEAVTKVEEIGSAVVEALQKKLDEHSPSKVAYQIGDYFGEGFINALDDNVKRASSSSSDLGESATDGLRDALARSAAAFDTSVDVQPTIRPVLDLSNVARGAGQINSMLGANRSMHMASEANYNMTLSAENRAKGLNVNNKDIVNTLGGLREDIGRMTETMANTQMVLDTGVLVGEMATPMDRALGSRAITRKRG